ncbi:MAG: outer membrane lipoprotein carrier protein LolA [Alphaproteobacteria bacterium]
MTAVLAVVWALAGAAVWAGPAAAAVKFSAKDQADIGKIERYINNIGTLKAKFLQVAPNGETNEGHIYLSRPGRLRVEYAPPSPILIIGNGHWLIYHDSDLEQTSYESLSDNLAGVLVAKDVKFSGKITVTGLKRSRGVIRIMMVMTEDPEAGSLTLTLASDPIKLRQWSVTDPNGQVTQVALFNHKFGIKLDEKLFEFTEPPRE